MILAGLELELGREEIAVAFDAPSYLEKMASERKGRIRALKGTESGQGSYIAAFLICMTRCLQGHAYPRPYKKPKKLWRSVIILSRKAAFTTGK